MTVQTKARKLVGTVAYRASVLRMIPLDDPDALGNMGLDGFDEEWENRDFKTKASAVRWVRDRMKNDPNCHNGEVAKIEWEPDEFDDREYGLVLDAIEVRSYVWDFYVNQAGEVVQGDEYKP